MSIIQPQKDSIKYFLGLSYLEVEQKQAELAIPLLESVASRSENLMLQQRAQWYLALAYLRSGQMAKAMKSFEQISKDSKHPLQSKASEALAIVGEHDL